MSIIKQLQGLQEANSSVAKVQQIEALLAKIKGSMGQDPNYVPNPNIATALDRVYTGLVNVATFLHQNPAPPGPQA